MRSISYVYIFDWPSQSASPWFSLWESQGAFALFDKLKISVISPVLRLFEYFVGHFYGSAALAGGLVGEQTGE